MSHLTTQFITCPKCEGLGKKEQKTCAECGGLGLGTFLKNDFLYWGYDITPAKIIIRQSRMLFDKMVNLLFFLFGCVGVISLFFWLTLNVISPDYKIYAARLFTFWSAQSNSILIFWLSMLAFLFWYFRNCRQKEKYQPVKVLKYWQKEKLIKTPQHIPNNWKELRNFRTKRDISKSYDNEFLQIIEEAYLLAHNLGHQEVSCVHVLLILLEDKKNHQVIFQLKITRALFARLNLHYGKIVPKLQNILQSLPKKKEENAIIPTRLSNDLRQSLVEAYLIAGDNGRKNINALDLIIPCLTIGDVARLIVKNLTINLSSLRNAIFWLNVMEKTQAQKYRRARRARLRLQKKMRRATTSVAMPILSYFTDNLTELMMLGSAVPVLADRKEIEDVFQAFNAGFKHVFLTGGEGIGKNAIVNVIAEKIMEDDVPIILRNKKLLQFNEEKIKKEGGDTAISKKIIVMLQEARVDKDVVLYIKNLNEETAKIITDYGSDIFIIASTSPSLPALGAQVITLDKPKNDELIRILLTGTIIMEIKYKVYFEYEAVEVAAYTAQTIMSADTVIDNGLRLLHQSANDAAQQAIVNINAVFTAKIAAAITGFPYTKILKTHENG